MSIKARSGAHHAPIRRPTPAYSPDPGALRRRADRARARLRARPVLLQREGRAVRGLRGRRRHQDRDALPPRRVRAVRHLSGQALQPRDARSPLQGQEHRRSARHDRRARRYEFFANIPRSRANSRRCSTSAWATSSSGRPRRRFRAARRSASKLSQELSKRDTGRTLYILDEPTTGLHFHDVEKLLESAAPAASITATPSSSSSTTST